MSKWILAALLVPSVAFGAEQEGGLALSVGTGPKPLQTLSAGVTGLGARVLIANGTVVPWFGLAATSVGTASFEKGERDSRFSGGFRSLAVSGGARIDLADRTAEPIVPYLSFGALVGRGGVASRDSDGTKNTTLGLALGGVGAFGLDAFVVPNLSLGAELGVMGVQWSGTNKYDGDEYSSFAVSGLSTTAGLQMTVWR